MSTPHPRRRPTAPRNNQQNTFGPGATGYVNQNGPQINNTTNVYPYLPVPAPRRRPWIGWSVLSIVVLDTAFFFYGAAAYTGRQGDSGDLWRAGIFLFLLATTGSLIRKWFRSR
ncbi:hypothetical protein [Amycolatopsis sp. lyj-109]|uniref:hypothetical protein n=1 Tax=Amycolatopsis sp. lyj-109 TaxID=2789287 RepID=UPI003978FF30